MMTRSLSEIDRVSAQMTFSPIDRLELDLRVPEHIDSLSCSLNFTPIDGVNLQMAVPEVVSDQIDSLGCSLNFDPVDRVGLQVETPKKPLIDPTCLLALLALINALGEFLYRQDEGKQDQRTIQCLWTGLTQKNLSEEKKEQFYSILDEMKKTNTIFYRLFINENTVYTSA